LLARDKKNGHLRARSSIHDPLGIRIQVCRVTMSPKQNDAILGSDA
jgi:hypothetical protein